MGGGSKGQDLGRKTGSKPLGEGGAGLEEVLPPPPPQGAGKLGSQCQGLGRAFGADRHLRSHPRFW